MNSNPQAVSFANTRIRPMADHLYSAYLTAKSLVQQWNSQNLSLVIPPGDATVIADGSATDGRPQITNDQAYAVVLAAQDFVNYCEGSIRPGNPDGSNTMLAPVSRAEVNGVSSF